MWSGQPGTEKALAWSQPVPLADVKAVGRAAGATVNDVLLASIAGGMQRYLAEKDESHVAAATTQRDEVLGALQALKTKKTVRFHYVLCVPCDYAHADEAAKFLASLTKAGGFDGVGEAVLQGVTTASLNPSA